jgi:hypothetical protein
MPSYILEGLCLQNLGVAKPPVEPEKKNKALASRRAGDAISVWPLKQCADVGRTVIIMPEDSALAGRMPRCALRD